MAFSLFGKPFGYAAGGRVQAPRTTNIADQHHKLAYINNEEEALLRARGGTGQAGPGGIPAFPPVRGKTQGRSNAGTGFSGGSGGGSSNNNNEPNRPPVGTGNGGSSGGSSNNNNEPNRPPVGTGNGGGGGGSSNNNNEPNRPPVGTGNGGSNNNSGGGGGADSGQAAAAEAARIERNRIAAKEAADRKEAQDQAIRDQIERDRAAQVESDRLQRNRDIFAKSQEFDAGLAQWKKNVFEGKYNDGKYNTDNFPGGEYQTASNDPLVPPIVTDNKAILEQAGFTIQGENVRDKNGAFVGKLSDPIEKLLATEHTGYSDYDDYMEKFGNDYAKSIAPKTAVVSTAQSTLDKEREQAKKQGKEFFKGSDGRFYSTDPKADAALQAALFNRSVPYNAKKTTQRRFLQTGLPVPVTLGMQTEKTWKTAVENLLQAILMLMEYSLCTAMFLAADLET
jgi:hypothetical protein